MDKISYALGLGIGQQIKSMNIENFSIEDFAKSISDVMEDKETAFTSREAQVMLQEFFQKKQKEEAEKFIAEGKAYLDENAKKEGVTVTKSGLQYEVLQEGTGKSPKATDTVRCHYEGRLLDGTVFDSSYKRGEPADFGLNQVIPGWTEGVQLMKEGAKYRFTIPYLLAYGEQGAGASIPPFSTLVFDVELIKVL
ncbi:MAG: FKBP-type peptidyl-prolyl cis-trans isomerase [Bacteroidaceae bacterium]|jgi:FKBP-type peptidyl-prolyl cis-trans isomerase FklB|nr:FKBP-type peptidyl-prolyl cis-trans isomerase [Bacteroidaceae bacterium]MBO7167958.1 FKBP-type peptidyl-prolyl cis-trans isomerase [Bacteroidaceae bacterium]MBQ5621815.1 FKBP-type peptidyl-prolyl cis-trans isomerase [Bacteroidaceae bacterium]MBR0543399.1 FKBP-type peptidyl-prolyl cis-trans isomerase [Bacteroidaceae bacterium]MBR4307454.1 FKBP-type peptidyl-prolyl cis-trans isomerase [Bacteroidaceae bacterium]